VAKKTSSPKIRRAPARPAAEARAPRPPKLAVAVDYPRENEAVRPGHYAIRLTAAGASSVQVRLDGGDWLPCREDVGHSWFDWAPRPGAALIEARARSGKGRWTAAPVRAVVVAD